MRIKDNVPKWIDYSEINSFLEKKFLSTPTTSYCGKTKISIKFLNLHYKALVIQGKLEKSYCKYDCLYDRNEKESPGNGWLCLYVSGHSVSSGSTSEYIRKYDYSCVQRIAKKIVLSGIFDDPNETQDVNEFSRAIMCAYIDVGHSIMSKIIPYCFISFLDSFLQDELVTKVSDSICKELKREKVTNEINKIKNKNLILIDI